MRSTRFKGNHHDSNNSMFSRGERIEQARERVMGQTFQYKGDDGNLASTGPTVKMGFFTEDEYGTVAHLKKKACNMN